MVVDSWLQDMGDAILLFLQSVPVAFWLAYGWAKEWQTLLMGLLLFAAAGIFSRGSQRAARIRAAAIIRAAKITAGVAPDGDLRDRVLQAAVSNSAARPSSPQEDLLQRLEQLRSLIRSAMSTLTADSAKSGANPNFYCERMMLLRFDENTLPTNLTPLARELYSKLLLQLSMVRRAMETRVSQSELSQALVQLNARAREFVVALEPSRIVASAATDARLEQKKAVNQQ